MRNRSGRSEWRTSGPVKLARVVWSAAYTLAMGEGVHLAGHMAFTALLAIFPFLIFLAALAGVLGDEDTANDFIDFMFRFMPEDVARTLSRPVLEVLTTRSGGLLTFGVIGTLWVASSGIEALRLGLNQAYGVPEARPLWYLRLQSIAFVVLGSLAIFLLSLSIILGPIIWEFLTSIVNLTVGERVLWDIVRYLFSIGVLVVAVLILHRWLPNARQRWRDMLPGAVATTLIWVGAGSVFSLYLGNLGNYSVTYGSLGGVIITLTFFYISALIFLFGAEFNVAFRRVFHTGKPAQR